MPRHGGTRVAATALLWAGFLLSQDPQRPVFRSETILVPVDVRVLDRAGRPVKDLTASNFTIREDDIPQEIAHFAVRSLSPTPPANGDVLPLRRTPWLEEQIAPHRTFAIVLGRGRLQHPAMGVDALMEFVRGRLLPQDWLTVVAYQRATDFTRDRAAIVRLLEQFRAHHAGIEAHLRHWFSDLQGRYGSTLLPPHIASRIDAVFSGEGLPRTRKLAYGADVEGSLDEHRETLVEAIDPSSPSAALRYHTPARHELESLYAAIEYLRPIEGEKHVIFVTEVAFERFGSRGAEILADMAADARVTLSIIQTGGVPTSWTAKSWNRPPQIQSRSWIQTWGIEDAKFAAMTTGGLSSMYRRATDALRHIDEATRVQYTLAYHPSTPALDGSRRRIEVTVNIPGASVHYRHVYFANRRLTSSNPAEFVKVLRMSTAAAYRGLMTDLPLQLSVAAEEPRKGNQLTVNLQVDMAALQLPLVKGRRAGAVELVVYVGDSRENAVGELQQRLDLDFSDEEHTRLLSEGLRHTAVVSLTGEPRYIKAILYHPDSDRLGSAVLDMRRRATR